LVTPRADDGFGDCAPVDGARRRDFSGFVLSALRAPGIASAACVRGKAARERSNMAIEKVSVASINGGKFLKAINRALNEAVVNCLDMDLPAAPTREVIAVLEFSGTRYRPLMTPKVDKRLAESALEQQFVAIHPETKIGGIENVEQDALYEPTDQHFPNIKTDLETLNDGKTIAEFNQAIQQVFDNYCDLDRREDVKRAVVAKFQLKIPENAKRRNQIQLKPVITPKLQPRNVESVLILIETEDREEPFDQMIELNMKETSQNEH
jgi:hypothetical protein